MNRIYPLLFLLFCLCFNAGAQSEMEPNNSFETANPIAEKITTSGTVNSTTDQYDYYRTILPEDGTLKIYVKGTNTSTVAGYLYMNGFDRRKAGGTVFGEYIQSSNTPAGATISDTITAYGRAADTFYFRINSTRAFSYSFSYEMVDKSTNDAEPNNVFEESVNIDHQQEKQGHIGYLYNGTSDQFDYYKTVLPTDGTLKVYVKGTNTSGVAGYLYINGYDRRKASGFIFGDYIQSSNTPAEVTIYDTITAYGRAADTFYFRINSSRAFSYSFSYEMVETSTNDVEPNNTFETAVPINNAEQKVGHIGYLQNGSNDANDYYKTKLPFDGAIKIMMEGINKNGASGYLYLNGYDKLKGSGTIFGTYISGKSSIPYNQIFYDTIIVNGQLADSFYFRLTSSGAFQYKISYQMIEDSPFDEEPNNTFEQAININNGIIKSGQIGYTAGGVTDNFDYYKTVLPTDGTLKVYVKGTNTSAVAGYLYMNGYDRRKASGTVFGEYIQSSNTPAGVTIYDTITAYGRAADTFYFRINSTRAFSYSFSYEMVDTSTNDAEPNNIFDEALPIDYLQEKQGHIGYLYNGTSDQFDYYKTVLPTDGTLKVYVKGINTSGASGYLYMNGYDRRKASGQVFGEYIQSSNTAAGAIIYDTITAYGRATDTFYFRINSTRAFSYSFSYEMVDTSTNDAEPNNIFDEALPIDYLQEKQGHIGYLYNGTSDQFDYYKTVLPTDGTLKVYVKGINTSGASGYLYMNGYDRRKASGQVFGEYIQSSNTAAGAIIYDTITAYGRATDTFYFRINSTRAFSYNFSYEMVDTSGNDAEPNNTINEASYVKLDTLYNGHIGYVSGGVSDANDYYYTLLPSKGRISIITEVNNRWGTNGYVHLYGYKNRIQTEFGRYIGGNSSLPAGSVTRDTIVIQCSATDTLFLRWTSSGSFSYSFEIDHIDLEPVAAIGHAVGGSLHEFTNLSSNATNFLWDLGEGSTVTNMAPELKSYGPGSYLVTLTSTNDACNLKDTASLRLSVKGLDRYTPTSGGPGNIEFTAYGGGFHEGMQVILRQGSTEFRDSLLYVSAHGNAMKALIDMHGAPVGKYDVEIVTRDTSYFYAAGYTTEGLVDNVDVEIIGRDVIRFNTNMDYKVRVNNHGNTVVGLVELFVLFPSYMDVTLKDSLMQLVNYQFDDLDIDTVPDFRLVTKEGGYPIDGKLYSFYVSAISAGGFRDLAFVVNSALGADKIYAWVSPAASGSDYRSWFDDCNQARLKLVADLVVDGASAIPFAKCVGSATMGVGSALYALGNWVFGSSGNAATASGLGKTTLGILMSCAKELKIVVPVVGQALKVADLLTDVAVMGSNLHLNYATLKDECDEDKRKKKEKKVDVRTSIDPNAKSGPSGYALSNYIDGAQKSINYTIFFENQPSATLPAQEVVIIDTLDKNVFELSTFRAHSYSIADSTYYIPGGAFDYITDVPYDSVLDVRMSIHVDSESGVMKAHFKTIDKATGAVTTDPLAGFLPPNHRAPEGEGSISFAIDLKNGLPDGTVIRNKSSIIFDSNEPIITNEWMNTLDRNHPASRVSSAFQVSDSSIMIKTSGTDLSSGVREFDLYISQNEQDFKYAGKIKDSILVRGEMGSVYRFYTVAIDSVGNMEVKTPAAEATVKLAQPLHISLGTITAIQDGNQNLIEWITVQEDMGDWFEVEKSKDGLHFETLTSVMAKGKASSYKIFDNQPGEGRTFYRLKMYSVTGKYEYSKLVSIYRNQTNKFALEIYPNPVRDRFSLQIHGKIDGRAKVTISNMLGRVIKQIDLFKEQTEIDFANHPAGTYFIRYTDNKKTEVLKVIKQ